MTTFKRGLSWASDNKDPTFLFTKPNSKISWLYNWSPNPTPGSSIRFVPMQWNQVDIENLRDKIIVHGQLTPEHILGFNEPERSDQANMSSEQAAQAWIHHIEPLRRLGIRCGSPGISSAPEGAAWLESFLMHIRARGSDIDFYAIHWYGETLGQFYDYIWSTYHRLGPTKPVWITEYAPTNWNTESPLAREHVEDFLKQSCQYLDGLEWVERYAWFGAMRDPGTVGRHAALLDDKGKLTELGKTYCSC
ncbi:hypothetical protein MMC14_002709 [Varicellaria rhodocarpa]|nr:hypothetical protein [Varicellaria rhodocarpa]